MCAVDFRIFSPVEALLYQTLYLASENVSYRCTFWGPFDMKIVNEDFEFQSIEHNINKSYEVLRKLVFNVVNYEKELLQVFKGTQS